MTVRPKQCKYSLGGEIPAHPCLREWACEGCPTQELISAILEEFHQDAAVTPGSEELAADRIGGFFWASNLFYHPSHFWLSVKRNGVRLGLDDIAQALIGRITEVILPAPPFPDADKMLNFELVCGRRRVQLTAPLVGRIRKTNISLYIKPELINIDPYGWGWLAEFDLQSLGLKDQDLLSGIKSREWFISEFLELHNLYHRELGNLSNDGGEIHRQSLSNLGDDEWKRLVRRILSQGRPSFPDR
jgi:glycine cleavage system H protein